jgi:hypothetical protein
MGRTVAFSFLHGRSSAISRKYFLQRADRHDTLVENGQNGTRFWLQNVSFVNTMETSVQNRSQTMEEQVTEGAEAHSLAIVTQATSLTALHFSCQPSPSHEYPKPLQGENDI